MPLDDRADERERCCKAVCGWCLDGYPVEGPPEGEWVHRGGFICLASDIRALPVLPPRTCAGCRWCEFTGIATDTEIMLHQCTAGAKEGSTFRVAGAGAPRVRMFVLQNHFCSMWEARPELEGEAT